MFNFSFFSSLGEFFTVNFPIILGAISILIIGWVVALILAKIVRSILSRTQAGTKIARWIYSDEQATDSEVNKWIGRAIYYLAIFFVLVAFFQYIGLTLIAEPLNIFLMQIFQYAPRIFGAAILLLVAWIIATILRMLLYRVLQAAKIDERLSSQIEKDEEKSAEVKDSNEEEASLSLTLSNVAYWVVFLFFVPAILSTLQLEGLMVPVSGMFENLLAYLPNILGAGLIILIGWLGARILQRIVTNLLSGVGLDRIGEKANVSSVLGQNKPSDLIGLVVYVVVLVFAIIGALNALALEAITRPASNMIDLVLQALPAVFAATLILLAAYVVGKVLASLVTSLLTTAGFDNFLVRLGFSRDKLEEHRSPSGIVGYIALIAVMLFAAIEASSLLGFGLLADLIVQLTVILGKVVVSVIIFGIGLYLAGLAKEFIQSSGGPHADILAKLTRIAILILVGAIALRQVGVANEIIIIAFGVLLGAIALTGVVAFGLGGREIAEQEIREWVNNIKKK